jgi:hypothetical protein
MIRAFVARQIERKQPLATVAGGVVLVGLAVFFFVLASRPGSPGAFSVLAYLELAAGVLWVGLGLVLRSSRGTWRGSWSPRARDAG